MTRILAIKLNRNTLKANYRIFYPQVKKKMTGNRSGILEAGGEVDGTYGQETIG